jgi:diguanylate cyclase (GGDEF)-like protein
MPASPERGTPGARPTPISGRMRSRSSRLHVRRYAVLLFLLTAALVGTVALTLDRNVGRSTWAQNETVLAGGARVAAASLGTLRSNLRVQASQIATSLSLQRALVTNDRVALEQIAAAHHAKLIFQRRAIGTIPPRPRIVSSASITSGAHVLARVAVGVALDDRVLALLRQTTPLPRHAALVFVRDGRVVAGASAGAPAHVAGGRLTIRTTEFAAQAAPLGVAGVSVVAVEPAAAVDEASQRYRRLVLAAALVTLMLMGAVAGRLASPIAQAVADVSRLARQAQTDALTGVANRRALDERLDLEVQHAAATAGEVSYVMADIDDFKPLNDAHGHQVGDEVLRAVAEAMQGAVRERDLVARYGGEELAVVLPGSRLPDARDAAERMRQAVAAVAVTTADGTSVGVTASFGVATFPTYPSAEAIVGAADAALYQAKRNGKNQVAAATVQGDDQAPPQQALAATV